MTESVASLYESGLERYKAGEDPQALLPLFKEICDRSPKSSPAWCSLAWLYLLADKPQAALRTAQRSVKLDRNSAQARLNLSIAMLETKTKGVREHIEVALRLMAMDSDTRQEVEANITDGLERRPDWQSLQRVQHWLAGG
ncbi:MAG: hypothetical protein HC838_01620 [Spirulinaceae cyanobacterium RM2_2_10]|nr:hypothetical protein [Spirulinaceae cyanobacterium SM2_1_0]NJO19021.1 hypothetical protein [Spirulinaceae cyanobacterium RM2_2_10]